MLIMWDHQVILRRLDFIRESCWEPLQGLHSRVLRPNVRFNMATSHGDRCTGLGTPGQRAGSPKEVLTFLVWSLKSVSLCVYSYINYKFYQGV